MEKCEKTFRTFRGIAPSDANGRDGLLNPERGFRFEIGIGKIPSDLARLPRVDQWPFPRFKKEGVTISQAYCYLTQFHSSDISDEKIAAIEADFERARREGFKFVLRFAYECDGVKSDGPTAERILAHIRQLTPVIRRNIDVIHVLQSGWIGLWGEFHTSVHGIEKDPGAVESIISATLDMLPEGSFTMMRRMLYRSTFLKRIGAYKPITPETAWSMEPQARIGFFNDGTLANWGDGGTFTEKPYGEPGEPEFDEVANDGRYLPIDGELFWAGQYSRTDFACGIRAIVRFHRHHYTTFSHVHGFSGLDSNPIPWTIDGWKVTPITRKELDFYGIQYDPAYFEGVPYRTAYEFIRDHLGYRLAATKASFSASIVPGGAFEASVTLRNYGFAVPVKPRTAFFVIVGADGSAVELPTGYDCHALQPRDDAGAAATHEIAFAGTLPASLPPGPHRIGLWLPDISESLRYRPEYAIRLATALPVEVVGGRLLNILA